MPDTDLPLSPQARRLFLFRCVELGWIVGYALLMRLLPLFGIRYGSVAGLDTAVELLWIVFGAVQVGLLFGLRREIGAHPAAGLLRAAFILAVIEVAGSSAIAVAGIWGADPWTVLGLGRKAPSIFFTLLSLSFDVVFWLALERLHGRVAPALRVAFFTLRVVSLGLSMLFLLLPFETYRSLLFTGSFAFAYPWLRLAVSASWNATVITALHRLSQSAPAPLTAGGEGVSSGSDATRDLIMGGVWLGGGLLITLATYSAAAAGGGGRYVVTTGAIVYGGVRLARGLARLGRT